MEKTCATFPPVCTDRRADRHRRRRSRRVDGSRSAARCRHRRSVARRADSTSSIAATCSVRSIRGCRRAAATGICAQVVEWNQRSAACGVGRTGRAAPADHARRRSLPGDRLDHRGRAALPRNRQETAHPLARCARRLQHVGHHAVRQHPRHAGRVPVRPRSARADRTRRQRAGDRGRHASARSASARSTPARSDSCATPASTSTTCATSTRSA